MFKFFRKRKLTYLIYSLSRKDENPSYHIDDIEYIVALQNIINMFEESFYENPFHGSGAFQKIKIYFANIFEFEMIWNDVCQLINNNQPINYNADKERIIDLCDYLSNDKFSVGLREATNGVFNISNELIEVIKQTSDIKRDVINRKLYYLIKTIKFYLIAVVNLYIEIHQLKIKKLSF